MANHSSTALSTAPSITPAPCPFCGHETPELYHASFTTCGIAPAFVSCQNGKCTANGPNGFGTDLAEANLKAVLLWNAAPRNAARTFLAALDAQMARVAHESELPEAPHVEGSFANYDGGDGVVT